MENTDVITKLRDKVKEDRVFSDVMHYFATERKRAGYNLTAGALWRAMLMHKFDWTINDIRSVLKYLAHLGIGKIKYDKRGNIAALREIGVTLPSVGKAAVGEVITLHTFKPHRNFRSLLSVISDSESPNTRDVIPISGPKQHIDLTVYLDGTPVTIHFSSKVSGKDLGDLIDKIRTA